MTHIPLITLPSVMSDLLIFLASSNLSPVASVCLARSLPAKSTRLIVESLLVFLAMLFCVKIILTSVCARLLAI